MRMARGASVWGCNGVALAAAVDAACAACVESRWDATWFDRVRWTRGGCRLVQPQPGGMDEGTGLPCVARWLLCVGGAERCK